MARWAIGDIQGCFHSLQGLLDRISYREESDELWLAGDLVNRGNGSAACLDWLRRRPVRAVLGNHDLHAIAVLMDQAKPKKSDTLDGLIHHPKRRDILDWLIGQPLTQNAGYWMSHAGLYPGWSTAEASALGLKAAKFWQKNPENFFSQMYGNQPDRWSEDLEGIERHRFVVNALTRMRYVDSEFRLDLANKGAPGKHPLLTPWFQHTSPDKPVLFGHWAALEQRQPTADIIALDSGCVWGQHLSAFNLDTHEWVQQPANPKDLPHV